MRCTTATRRCSSASLCDNIDEIQPIIYTPTVGLACQKYGLIFQRPRGMFISAERPRPHRRDAAQLAASARKLIVVTDGERILGLGDLGANGMGIPVGKLSLYSACAGVHPEAVPAGHARRRHQQRRAAERSVLHRPAPAAAARAPPMTSCVEEFMTAARRGLSRRADPVRGLRQSERVPPAAANIATAICVFNDDIQGTAAVALAGMFSALRVTGGKLDGAEDPVSRRGRGGDRHRRSRRLRHDGAGASEAEARAAQLAGRFPRPGRQGPRRTSPSHKLPLCARPCAGRRVPRRRSRR